MLYYISNNIIFYFLSKIPFPIYNFWSAVENEKRLAASSLDSIKISASDLKNKFKRCNKHTARRRMQQPDEWYKNDATNNKRAFTDNIGRILW